jgi:hypothetical protein
VKLHTNAQGVTGIGVLSGDSYSFNETNNEMGEFDAVAGGTGHFVYHLEFIHQGEVNPNPSFAPKAPDDKHVHFNGVVELDQFGNPTTTVAPQYECR